MRVPRARVSIVAVLWVALAGAMLLVTPREFDRVRPARAGSQRLDFADAAHGPADDHAPPACALTPGEDGAAAGQAAPGTGAAALLVVPGILATPSFRRLSSQTHVSAPLSRRPSLRSAGRAPPHA